MKFNPSWFLFFSLSVIGFVLVVGSDNSFIVWLGFELSLIGFLPMFFYNSLVSDGVIKYFLVQAAGSSLFLVSSFISWSVFWFNFLLLSMFLKLGAFPFFQWVPVVMSSLSWYGCFFLATIQKLAPLFMLLSVGECSFQFAVLFVGCGGVLVSGLLGFNQTIMRFLVGYSSIAHTSWILSVCFFNLKVLFFYLFFYFVVSFFLFITLEFNSVNKVSFSFGGGDLLLLSFILLVLSGMPPFVIFYGKLLIFFIISNFPAVVLLMLLGAFLSFYFYLIIIVPGFLKFGGGFNVNGFNLFFLVFVSSFVSFFVLL
nr:NADH dehydrogenase subunit 2 [Parantropora penelope]